MVIRRYISLLVFGIILFSCKKNNPEGTIYTDLNAFSEIELSSNFDVYLIEDSVFSIEIKGFEKSISKVEYFIESDILKVDNKQKYKFTRPKTNKVTLYIHSKPLRKLTSNETCFIRTVNPITSDEFGLIFKSKANFAELDLAGNIFYYWNTFPCGGKLTLKGTTNQLKLWNTAILSVDAKGLTANYAVVENSSKGLCEVNVINKLEYSLLGDGNIDLYGNPPIKTEVAKTGKGELIVH
tara:strand:+ start:228 stop:944 length:717 start_codon:yes stop_codon:yes gene_type:complete